MEGSLSEVGTPASYSSLQRLELGGHRSDVRTCALSADGTLLATASNTQLKVRTRGCVCTQARNKICVSLKFAGFRATVERIICLHLLLTIELGSKAPASKATNICSSGRYQIACGSRGVLGVQVVFDLGAAQLGSYLACCAGHYNLAYNL